MGDEDRGAEREREKEGRVEKRAAQEGEALPSPSPGSRPRTGGLRTGVWLFGYRRLQ